MCTITVFVENGSGSHISGLSQSCHTRNIHSLLTDFAGNSNNHFTGCNIVKYSLPDSASRTSHISLSVSLFPAFNLFFQICLKSVNLRLSNYFFYGL
ncbi:hypothetical protein EG339_13680 [Chryseobacterium bernardetii]|uniref:Uncharacterized protein n=1 Tax=Chryseobacterium bernardetii TaxID=1241978 RepID=A0A3G6T8M7_9FLAO|nr:hypothetical protein EG339_13680 [Chryseobacterium bernardetii]